MKNFFMSLGRERVMAAAFVIGLHLLVGLAFLTHKIVIERESPPMIVRLLDPPVSNELPKPVQPVEVLNFKPQPLPVAIMPDVMSVEEARPNAITVAAIKTPAEVIPTVAAQEPIVEAIFDADYLNNPRPVYPSIARRMKEQGLVILKVKIRADGTVDSVLVEQRSGSVRLDEAALAVVRRWKFVPAQRAGQPIESWVFVPIEFKLNA